MPVRFFVEGAAAALAVSPDQGDALLAALGEDAPARAGGRLMPAPLAARLAAVRRQLALGRLREFTAPALDADGLLRAVGALAALAAAGAAAGLPITFEEDCP